MANFSKALRGHGFIKSLSTLAVALPLAVGAQVTAPALSGPSTGKAGEVITFSGSGLVPNSAVSVSVRGSQVAEAVFSAVAGPEGTLAHTFRPPVSGSYVVTLLDTGGRVLATVNLHVAP